MCLHLLIARPGPDGLSNTSHGVRCSHLPVRKLAARRGGGAHLHLGDRERIGCVLYGPLRLLTCEIQRSRERAPLLRRECLRKSISMAVKASSGRGRGG